MIKLFSHYLSQQFFIYLFLFSLKIELCSVRRRRTWLPLPVQGLLSRIKMMFNVTLIAMPSFHFV